MGLGPCHALGQQLALQVIHQLAVLGVHRGHGAQLQTTLEAGDQGVVSGHDGVLVGHEVLETVHPMVSHQLTHLLGHLVAPPGDGHVKAVIAGALFCPTAPGVKRVHQRLLRIGNHEIDDGAGPACQPGGGAAEKVLAGYRAHERQLHVGMRVDPAGHQVLAAAIEHVATDRWVDGLADGLDQAVCTQDIGAEAFFVGDHGGATDQQRHAVFLAG